MSLTIHSKQAPQFPLPFSHAVIAGDFVYISGQVGVDPATSQLVGDTIEEQTAQCFRNIEIILQETGLTLDHVIKVNAYVTRPEDFPKYNEIYATLLNKPYPTRTSVPSDVGPYLIEIDVVAYAPFRRAKQGG